MDFADLPLLIEVFVLFTCLLNNCYHCSDVHGGVPMGRSKGCDNGVDFISIDWDPNSTEEFTCDEDTVREGSENDYETHCEATPDKPTHICYNTTIHYTVDIPASGAHRPVWPAYGEYSFIPRQRYLHSLEHGAVVFLYHPCANTDQIRAFKKLARSCLRRHIISANKNMPTDINFVLLSWGCKLQRGQFNKYAFIDFVKEHALKGRETVFADGHYIAGRLERAETLTTMEDTKLCPDVL